VRYGKFDKKFELALKMIEMKSSKNLLFKGVNRGIFGNSSFKIQSIFSNGRSGTGTPDNFGLLVLMMTLSVLKVF
jgi:hypothetical protein